MCTLNPAHQEATRLTAYGLMPHAFLWASHTEYTNKTVILHFPNRAAFPWKARFIHVTQRNRIFAIHLVVLHSKYEHTGEHGSQTTKKKQFRRHYSIQAITHSGALLMRKKDSSLRSYLKSHKESAGSASLK